LAKSGPILNIFTVNFRKYLRGSWN